MATKFGEKGSSLVAFVQQLKGTMVDVELKNSSIVSGQVEYVDTNMNTHLRHVKITAKGKNPVEQDRLMVRGGTIRYFILPPTLSVDDKLKAAAETVLTHRKRDGGAGGAGSGAAGGKKFGGKRPRENDTPTE